MRKLVYYVACSIDGFISHADGSAQGFLTEGEHLADLFSAFPEALPSHIRNALNLQDQPNFDTVLMGRHTYEIGVKEGILSPYSHLKQCLFSRSLQNSPHEDLILVRQNALQYVQTLKQEAGKDIWLCGGGKLATSLFSEIDHLILKINPFIMGSGIPLFSDGLRVSSLAPLKSKVYANGFVLLHYRIKHEGLRP